jgi:MFS family permease
MTRVLICGCLPALLGAFDFGFLALAGPRLAPSLGVAGSAYPWLFSTSSFAYGAAVMPAVALTARMGPARVLALGLAGVAAGAGTLAATSGLASTLVARALNGAGGALAAIAALALLAAIAREDQRRTAFAALGGAIALGFAAGALAAGIEQWRVVLGAVGVIALASASLAASLRPGGGSANARGATSGWGTPASVVRLRGGGRLTVAILCGAAGIAGADAREWWAIPALGLAAGLGVAALRRATDWLPPHRTALAAAVAAGAATTASGVGATILIAGALATHHLPGALLGAFGLAVLPGSSLASRLSQAVGARGTAAIGLAVQALGLIAVAAALTAGATPVVVAILVFATGHVVANGGSAATVAEAAGAPAAPAVGLLIAAQYLAGGIGPLAATAIAAAHGAQVGIVAAAVLALVGACPIVVARRGASRPVRASAVRRHVSR